LHTRAGGETLLSATVDFDVSRLVSYLRDEKPLVVIAVLHGRRSPRVIAAIQRAGSRLADGWV